MAGEQLRVGFVGAGAMGRPMIERLRGAGHRVTTLARRPEVAEWAAGAGAAVVDDVDEAGRDQDLVIVCVYTDSQVDEVCLRSRLLDGMSPGTTVVVHTTGSPLTAEAIAARAGERGIDVLDAPVSGGPQRVQAGNITLLVGGEAGVVERCRPALASYGDPIIHLGPLGTGQRVKLVNNTLFGAHLQLAVEAARVGDAFGIDPATLARALVRCSGTSMAIELLAGSGAVSGLLTGAGPFVAKDLDVVEEVAGQLEVDLGLLGAVAGSFRDGVRDEERGAAGDQRRSAN